MPLMTYLAIHLKRVKVAFLENWFTVASFVGLTDLRKLG